MKKLVILLTILSLFLIGCKNTRIQSPEGKVLKLSSKEGNIQGRNVSRIYYLAWGLVPLNDNSSDTILSTFDDGDEIIAESKVTFIDALISGAGNSVIPTTLTVKSLEVEKIN